MRVREGNWKGVDGSLVWREGCSKEGKAWGSGEQRTRKGSI